MEGHQSISFDSPQLLLVAMYLTTVLSLIVLVAAAECIPLNQVETQHNTRWTLRSILTSEFCQNHHWLFNNLGLYRCDRTCDFIRMSQICDNARHCGHGDDEVGCNTLNGKD